MRHCRKTIGLLAAVCVLMPSGCASQWGRLGKKHEVNTAQLLAAARQYEKEGQARSAAHIYQHVLKYHPGNSEAQHGLALVQQGKLRVKYDTQQLLASTNPKIQENPQARELLAKQQELKKEQVTEQMAQLIASVEQPREIEVEATPTPAMIASRSPDSDESERSKPIAEMPDTSIHGPRLVILESMTPKVAAAAKSPAVAQAEALADESANSAIETTGFTNSPEKTEAEESIPADWTDDSAWRPHSLTHLCKDANAAVLKEVAKLDSHVDEVRKEGLTNLAQMGAEAASAKSAIRRLLTDKNQLVAAHAAWAAWEVERNAEAVIQPLITLLESPNSDVVQFAAYTLSSIGPPAEAAARKLQELLDRPESVLRLHAAEALIHVAGPQQRGQAVDILIILLKDEEADVRSLAAMMLGVADAENVEFAVASLTSALDDEDDRVRSAAALSLGAYGSQAELAVEKLEELAHQDHTEVREAAQTALSCIKL